VNHLGHVSVLVNVEPEWLALYTKECSRFCGHFEYNFWNIYRSGKYSYLEQTAQRNVLCPMYFARGMLCFSVSYFDKTGMILIKCIYQATNWTNEESWFDCRIGKGVIPCHNFHTSCRVNAAAY